MKYHIFTYGCAMNLSDSERIQSALESAGFDYAEENEAEIGIFNTCSVRDRAEQRAISKLKQFRSQEGSKVVVLTGCMAKQDRWKKELRSIVDIFLGIEELETLPNLILKTTPEIVEKKYFHIDPNRNSKFQALVPIMTGCNNFCSYCIVPYVRGREYSRPKEEILSEIKNLVEKGYKEITLIGQNVNSYNPKRLYRSENQFAKLLKEINEIKGDFWIKFVSSHPKDFNLETIETIKSCEKICHYLSLPPQHGDDEILAKMNRGYTSAQYLKLIKSVRKAIPDMAISADFIVGFPGETPKHFKNLKTFFKKLKPDMAYMAMYSPRHGTASAKMKDNVKTQIKKSRFTKLNLQLKIFAKKYNAKFKNKTLKVLITKYNQNKNTLMGITEHNKDIRIKTDSAKAREMIGTFKQVKVLETDIWSLTGEIAK